MDWWKRFWDKYYLSQLTSREPRTKKEVSFILNALDLPKKAKILDLGCGPGRHSIGLAKRGYKVVGLDYSKMYIDYAKQRIKNLSLDIKFVRADMRDLKFRNEFDAVINVYSSFGYFSDKENFKVFQKVYSALKSSGKFLIDVSNRDSILKHFASKPIKTKTEYGKMIQAPKFNYATSRLNTFWTIYSGSKKIKRIVSLRIYSYHELRNMLEEAGFTVIKSYGGFSKEEISADANRLVMVCRK